MKSYQVIEFEKIYNKSKIGNNDNIKAIDNNYFSELVTFVKEFNKPNEYEDPYTFLSISTNRRYGDFVSFRNYCGLIELKSGYQIEILPKIHTIKDNDTTKDIFLAMLKSLKDFEGKASSVAHLDYKKFNLYEIFINMYLSEVLELSKKGLKSKYIPITENLNVLKGKLSIKDQIRINLIHKERFYVTYDNYEINKPINKLIKSTLLKLQGITKNNYNKKLARRLLIYFELVEPSDNYDSDYNKISFNRTNKDYEWVINWSMIFLKNNSFINYSGPSKSRALLFPMEKLFESYVAKNVRKIFRNEFHIKTQHSSIHLFDDPKCFKLRPDIVLKNRNNEKIIILDTKWKNLTNGTNYGISMSDMYQMYAYSKKYANNDGDAEVWLIFPSNDKVESHERKTYIENNGVKVNIFTVDLTNIKESLDKLKELL